MPARGRTQDDAAMGSSQAPDPYRFRDATEGDIDAIVAVVNLAYRVEDFFIDGDRTHAGEVRENMRACSLAVVIEAPGEPLCASIFTKVEGSQGYFGMLSVHPERAHRGLGTALIAEAERRAREAGCDRMKLVVVNLREDIIPWYRRLGYVETGTAPFAEPQKLKQPAHFVEMTRWRFFESPSE
ncbi:MAG: GNAT family N-acetyltransferase [Dehalococcoidia bacterium]|nr:GNAT family N-acetyltransferase [Dehalococcoidia bacterium]